MKISRIFSDQHGDSHFDEVNVELFDGGDIGYLSKKYSVTKLQFRKVDADYDYDFHCAPQKQYIVLLDGGIEVETSLGEKRQINSGEILLVEDVIGKGHRTKNLEKRERTSLFIHID